MTFLNCENRQNCTGIGFIVSLIIGVIAAFLQITAVITLTPIFSIVALGIATVYLAVVLLATAIAQHTTGCNGCCQSLSTLLLGIIGTILVAVVLLLVSFAATSVIGAIFVGALSFFFSLTVISTACLARCFLNCRD